MPAVARLHDDLSIIALLLITVLLIGLFAIVMFVFASIYSYLSNGNSTEAVMYPIRISLEARESPELQQTQQQRSSGGWGPWR